jgi:YidC/Oxa1 family membrane protein insertase
MQIWAAWLDIIERILSVLSSDAELGLGLAIIVGTLLMRVVLLPVAGPIAYRTCIRQKKLIRLQPELQRLKEQFSERPDAYMQKMVALYRKHDLSIMDAKSFLGIVAQMPIFLGMFQVLRQLGEGVRFLWVPDLLRPDAMLAFVAGLTTALMIMINPDMPEQMRTLLIVLPTIIVIVSALKFSSALAVYWATSNTFSAIQTFVLHRLVRHRIQSGEIIM